MAIAAFYPDLTLSGSDGFSSNTFGTLFRAEFGLAPKEAARVIRFDRARRRIGRAVSSAGGRGAAATFATLAAECGFYDQAHLAREFRALAGCPPSQWLAEEFRFVQASAADLGE